jgi:methionine-S-sulfoxide reductase
VRTRVGFAGGTGKNPTYRNILDHSETIQIDYDPAVTSYAKMLEVFWKSHNPCAASGSRQYRTAIFYQNDQQKKFAFATRDAEAARRGRKIVSAVEPMGEFTLAEDYHQKYYLRNMRDIMKEFSAMYPDLKGFVNSTAAMRVNAYIDGYGSLATLEKDIKDLGLSPEAGKKLIETFKQRAKSSASN